MLIQFEPLHPHCCAGCLGISSRKAREELKAVDAWMLFSHITSFVVSTWLSKYHKNPFDQRKGFRVSKFTVKGLGFP